jgi:multidrug resistance protein
MAIALDKGSTTHHQSQDPKPWTIFSILLISSFIMIEAAAFQAPAIPTIARHFGISAGVAALISMIYYLSLVVCSPIFGRLADRFGRRRILIIGMVLFIFSELMAAVTPNFAMLLVARFFQGLSVACVLPVILSYIGYLFAPEKRGMPLGVMVFSASLGGTSGAIIGGLLIDSLGWRSIYAISALLAFAGLLLMLWKVPETPRNEQSYRFDSAGAALLLVSIAGLLATPTCISRFGFFSLEAIGAFLIGVISFAVLWRLEKRVETPVIDISIMSRTGFLLPGIIYMLFLVCYGGTVYAMSFFVSDRPGGSASEVGLINMFVYGSSMLAGLVSGKLVDKFSEKNIVIGIVAIMAGGLLLYTQIELDTPLWALAGIAVLFGVCQGMKGPAIMKIALAQIPANKMSAGSGLFSMMRDFGTPAGVGIGLAVYSSSLASNTREQLMQKAQSAGLDPSLLPALNTALISKGQDVSLALQQGLEKHNLDYVTLVDGARKIGMANTLPEVGAMLFIVVGLAFVLALMLPRQSSREA